MIVARAYRRKKPISWWEVPDEMEAEYRHFKKYYGTQASTCEQLARATGLKASTLMKLTEIYERN